MSSNDSSKSKPIAPMYELDPERYKQIGGTASDNVKQHLANMLCLFMRRGTGFGDKIGGRLRITEVSVQKKAEEPERKEGRVVCEIAVDEDMVNGGNNMHGGCTAYLIDVCGSLPIIALSDGGSGGVSQVIDVIYHSPAQLGDTIRIVSTTMSIGSRAMSARSEIWSTKHHRLVASGIHIKMHPSPPKL